MKQAKLSGRRKFLLAAGLGGVGAAAVAVTGRKAAQGTQGAAPAGEPRGYHVSEHILKYYKTTLV